MKSLVVLNENLQMIETIFKLLSTINLEKDTDGIYIMTNMILGAKRVIWTLATLNQATHFFSTIVFAGFIFLGMNKMMLNQVVAAPQPMEETDQQSQSNFGSVITAVLEDASQRSGLPTSAFQEITAERKTWSDGCLGVHEPGQACTQALVPGWRITLSHDSQTWIYHTSTDGRIRLASQEQTLKHK